MHDITTFSNRLYVDENEQIKLVLNEIETTIKQFNHHLYHTYNLLVLEREDNKKYLDTLKGESLHMYVKHRFNLDDYYANSIVNLAKGKIDSQIKLNKEYIKQKEESLKIINKNIKDTEDKLLNYMDLKKKIHKYQKEYKDYEEGRLSMPPKIKVKGIRNLSFIDNTVEIRYFKNKALITKVYGLYEFEYKYLNDKINYLKNMLGQYKYRNHILENQINNLNKIKRSIFGTKKFMREYSKCEDPKLKQELKRKLFYKKYKEFIIFGRKDAGTGNFVFKPAYNSKTNSFDIEIKLIDGKKTILNNIVFPYRQNELIEVLGMKTPICFAMVRKTDHDSRIYYQIKVTFDLSLTRRINRSTDAGCVGLDYNHGHIEMTDIDGCGNPVKCKTFEFSVTGTSYENELALRLVLDEIGQYVAKQNKILIVEELNTSQSKYKDNKDTKNKQLNKSTHDYAYAKYNEFVEYIGIKYEFEVRKVNPAFTSIIGELKYSNNKKMSRHMAASLVIARRGMGFEEKLLWEHKKLLDLNDKKQSNWKQWSLIDKRTNK